MSVPLGRSRSRNRRGNPVIDRTGRKGREVRAIATLVGSRASRTAFTTVRQNGAAFSPWRESRCAEYRMKWLAWMLAP
jgi:hypothetical protein